MPSSARAPILIVVSQSSREQRLRGEDGAHHTPDASPLRWARLAGRAHGDEEAPGTPLVFLHGLTFDRRMWDTVLDALPSGRRAIAFDLPGHGHSAALPEQGLAVVAEAIHEAVLGAVALRLKAGDPTIVQVDAGDDGSADFSFARNDVSAIKAKGGDGNDSIRVDDANGAFTDSIPTTIAGDDGNDSLEGGQLQVAAENETFRGGDGNDVVDGGKGNDTAYLGDGNDTFRWDNGEGSDVIEGQDGTDTMLFNGAAGAEDVTMTANGGRLTFFRVQGNVTMDTDGVEIVDDNALGGPDNVTVNDLTGTDVTQTNLDLASALGGSAADGALDSVVVNGTNDDDSINITGNGSGADVTGLATAVSVTHVDPIDSLSVNTLAGTDNVLVNGVAGVLQVLVDGAPI
jgi:Alpha/beta hydrolase family/RTX calcium-binding nonapeptide repeat (4 copies)